MSYHVYIARSGWRDTPISPEEWSQAVSEESALEARPTPRGDHLMVHLEEKPRKWLNLTQGYVHAQDPGEELVAVMFQLASRLDARVYSERAKPYESVADWRNRTKRYRVRRDAARAEAREATRRRRFRLAGVLVAGALLGVCHSYL